MPIKPERKALYPADWADISKRIREERAHGCCGEWCGAVNGADIGLKGARVVLTVAHLDHDPRNNADGNLAALCQRCHLRHDAEEHAAHARETWRQRKACGDLFDKVPK